MCPEESRARKNMLRCMLCANAPCDDACGKGVKPARQLRSIWFENERFAASRLPPGNPCAECAAPCETACLRREEVPIKAILSSLAEEVRPRSDISVPKDENALRTEICGVPLENPFLLSSSVVASNYDMCSRAFEAGWAGAAFKTICSFDIHEASPRLSAVHDASGGIVGFKNIEQLSEHSVAENMEIFQKLKKKYPAKFILASIMGRNDEEWEELARTCEENGADAMELNFSCPNMMEEGLGSDIGQAPSLVEHFTAAARRGAKIPVLAKLTPNVAFMSPAAEAAKRGGADGISAINTIKSIMGVDPYTYVSSPAVQGQSAVGGYSGAAVKPIALRFVAEMGKNPNLSGMHISGIGGIETWKDALEFMLLGAGSVQITTAVMQYGYRIIDDLKGGLNFYLHERGIENIGDIIGKGLAFISNTTDSLARDTVTYPRFRLERCIGCGRCEISCSDGGHQAIRMNENRRPVLNPMKCVGCHLCVLVCPCDAICSSGKWISKEKIKN